MHEKRRADLGIHARWVVPVDGDREVLSRAAVMVTGGRIVEILDSARAAQGYRADEWVELDRHVLMPGMVNAHTHAAMTLMRGFADDLPLMEWLRDHVWPAESAHVDEDFVDRGTRLAILEMIRSGTTCFNDMYFFPDSAAAAALDAGMRVNLGMIVLETPSAWAADGADYIDRGLALHDRFRHEDLVTLSFAPHAPYTVEDDSLKRIQILADELDAQIHIHLHETAAEIDASINRYGVRPLERLAALGLATPRLQAVHMTRLLKEEIGFCARNGVHVVHCPQSNLKLASGFALVAELLEAGVNVALGTDGAASNNDLDMFEETRCSALLAKAVAGSPARVPAHRAIEMATLNGARALGLEDVVGSLEPGKAADLVAVDFDHPRTQPVYDPVSQLVYSACSEQVSDVWIGGRRVLDGGCFPTLDRERVLADAREWQGILARRRHPPR